MTRFVAVCIITLFLLQASSSRAQQFTMTGHVKGMDGDDLDGAIVELLSRKDSAKYGSATDNKGNFEIKGLSGGKYHLTISYLGYERYGKIISLSSSVNLGTITLFRQSSELKEVKIISKVIAMVQKDDTLEFNSGAYKVNPDADAADLVKKMPGIDVNGKTITAQGENVTKIVVDGKPFFGSDPYAALKNLPADVIDKVQVYNERSDQEQFTGFSEGNTTKTVNIVTKKDKKEGVFGKLYAGGGEDNNGDGMYGTGFSLNQFKGDRRITVTGQSNNVNIQNFSDDNASGGGATGLSKTNAGGINYTDKLGKKVEVAGSYFFNSVSNDVTRQTQKTYLVAIDSGQVYNETNPSSSEAINHRFSSRINYIADSFNSVLVQPQFSFHRNSGLSGRTGKTMEGTDSVNRTNNTNNTVTSGINFSGNILYRHKFHKKGRTFSLNLVANNSGSIGTTIHTAEDIYYTGTTANDTINQKTLQDQNTWNLSGNATYTEPVSKTGVLKLEYNVAYTPANSQRNTWDADPMNNYSRLDDNFSSDFVSHNLSHKTGASYMVHNAKAEISVGLNYQLTSLHNIQYEPVNDRLNQDFQDVLPTATFHYKFSKTRNLQCTYNTSTQTPSVTQLQNVVNNTDPLHLYVGNPGLRQTYRHNITIRYNTTSATAKNSFSASVNGSITQHGIASSSFISASDTMIGQNHLAKGSQLTMPVNIEGNSTVNANVNYGLPLDFIKCRLNLAINGTLAHSPARINGHVNYQDNQSGGLTVSVNSNISENADFSISSGLNVTQSNNSINTQINSTYVTGNSRASVNFIFWKGFVLNSSISYQSNSGLAASYDQDYVIWNVALGKKLFKKRQGDIRLSAFDVLNQNNNIQHTITDIYIQDTRSNILQRYVLLVFTYKISEFKKAEEKK